MCICGHEQIFESCCKPYIDGDKIAQSSETLMRSRYSAYAQGNAKYIFNTYAKDKQAENPVKEIAEFANSCQFIKLEIIDSQDQSDTGYVKFKAHYLFGNLYCTLHEKSEFIKVEGAWFYLDGDIKDTPEVKLNRNDVCPCGSNKKFKKCHYQ